MSAVESLAGWPAQRSICVDCRTVLTSGEPCDAGPKHNICSLDDAGGRETLRSEVWGPASKRRRARELAKAGGGGAAAGGASDCALGGADCSGCDAAGLGGEGAGFVIAIVVAAFVAIILYYLIKKLVEYIRRRRQRLKANGALSRAARLGRGSGTIGEVVAGTPLPEPIGGTECVAYGVALRAKGVGRGGVMLRLGATLGFDIRLGSGELLRVPPGRAIVDMRGSKWSSAPDRIAEFLTALDPEHGEDSDDLSAFPVDLMQSQLIRPGDRVEVLGKVELIPDADAGPTGYREAAGSILVPAGVPRLRLVTTG